MNNNKLKETPWDTNVFGIYTAEVLEYTDACLEACNKRAGIYTLKVDSLESKQLALSHGFYYCDTLLAPTCEAGQLVTYTHAHTTVEPFHMSNKDRLLSICSNAFTHDRFHKDFNINSKMADARYVQWLESFMANNQVYTLLFQDELAGFIAFENNVLQLHAIASPYRGQGLGKYWWSTVCSKLLEAGYQSLSSSVSASNLAVINLYQSLGFKFEGAIDIYHKHVKTPSE